MIENKTGKSFDKNKYRENLNTLAEKEIKLPWEIACGVVAIEAMDTFKGLIETKDPDEVLKFAEAFADMIGPNVVDGDVPAFDPFRARVDSLLVEMMDACQSSLADLTPCVYEPPEADTLEEEDMQAHMVEYRWKARM